MQQQSPSEPEYEVFHPRVCVPAAVEETLDVVNLSNAMSRIRAKPVLPASSCALLDQLIRLKLLEPARVESFLQDRAERLDEYSTDERLGHALVQAGLLTVYQFERILTGATHGLVLGSYRVLEGLGTGGMGVVYRAEHCLMHRRVAVKVLPIDEDCPPAVRQRFYSEMRLLADLNHPNIVLAFDAGEVEPAGPGLPGMIYLVMEIVEGGDLDKLVVKNGRCEIARGCDFIRQAATGLQTAHDRHLIHRDIKPSNLLLTPTGQVKLVDFGLVRRFCSKLTDPRALLGSIEFMAPEQSFDPSAVGKEADIYGLGATLFWLLTGEAPYPFTRSVSAALRALQQDQPRQLTDLRPDVPEELNNLVVRMLDRNPAARPTLPIAVARALTPFVLPAANVTRVTTSDVRSDRRDSATIQRVLIASDEESNRRMYRMLLENSGCTCFEAANPIAVLSAADMTPFDLILLDLNTAGTSNLMVCHQLRERATGSHLKIILVQNECHDLTEVLACGADDYIVRPADARQLTAKVEHAVRLKESQDRADLLAEQLFATNRQLQQSLEARTADVREAHNAILFAMAKMGESRDGETPGHLRRLQLYARTLAVEAAKQPLWAGLVDERFLDHLERCVPLHDIGKIGLPDDILLKPASLNNAERLLVETHPLIGDRILESLGREHGAALDFLGMARGIVRHHHERFDGRGYPDRLIGDEIPAAARLTAVADVYDALRRERLHKPAMPHDRAVQVLLQRSEGQFDPTLLQALETCHSQIEQIYREVGENY